MRALARACVHTRVRAPERAFVNGAFARASVRVCT